MSRVKVKVERGNGLQQVITIDTAATQGAKLGSDLYLPSGQVATPTSFLQWLGITGSTTSGGGGGGGGGPSLSSILKNKGDLVTRDSQVQALGIGTTGQALVVAAGLPSWGAVGVPGGGTGFASYDAGDMLYAEDAGTFAKLPVGVDGDVMRVIAGFPDWAVPGALTRTNDTNVTLTLGGAPNTALLDGVSLTLGWDGQLIATRGGTGFGSYAVGDILFADTLTTLERLPIGDEGDVLTVDYDGTPIWAPGGGGASTSAPETRGASFSGGNSAIIVPTNKVPINIREDCTITAAILLTQGGTGDCVLDIWRVPYAGYPPDSGDSICGGNKPTISSDVKDISTLVGWETALSAGDTLLVNLESSSTFTAISLFLVLTPVDSTPSDGYTDERCRDVIAAALTDSPTVQWVYDDSLDEIVASVDAAALDVFTDTDAGVVPASGGDASEFLCADGTFKSVAGTGGITSGTYTPTVVNGTNVSANTPGVCSYMRVGDTVTVSGVLAITCSASGAGTSASVYISLPVASAFANASDCGGAAHVWSNSSQGAAVAADTTGDRAEMRWENLIGTSSQNYAFSFTYRII